MSLKFTRAINSVSRGAEKILTQMYLKSFKVSEEHISAY